MQHVADILINGVSFCAQLFGPCIPIVASGEIALCHANRAQQGAGTKVTWAQPVSLVARVACLLQSAEVTKRPTASGAQR